MAGVQSIKVRQHAITTTPEQPSYHASPSLSDRAGPGAHNSPHPRDFPALRGRPLPLNNSLGLLPQPQPTGRAISPRSQPTNGEPPGRPLPGALERRPSATYGHHRQTSIVHGVTQHSRNPSLSNSSNLSHRSPQSISNGSEQTNFSMETPSFTSLSTETSDLYSNFSPSSTANTSLQSNSSTSTLYGDREAMEVADNTFTQKRVDRVQTTKPNKDHSRSQSKHQVSPEQRSVGEYALHHLFNSFVGQADSKINQCVQNLSGPEPRVEDICGPGVDPDFDQLISALGHIARQKPKPLIDTVMYWRKARGEALATAREAVTAARNKLNQSRNISPVQRPLPRRNTEPVNIPYPDSRNIASTSDSNYANSPSLEDKFLLAERRCNLSIYLLCRVLIEVYHQSDLKSITPYLAEKLEDIVFEQLQRTDPDNLASSSFRLANWTIFSRLLGVMSSLNFHSVSQRFTQVLKAYQNDMGIKGTIAKEAEDRVVLAVLATKTLHIRTQPEHAWKESCDFMHDLGRFFVNSHGQPIKHACCQVLERLVFPVAASAGPQLATQRWKDFLNMINPRLTQMLAKPRNWLDAFPLSTLVLCASPMEVFASQWLPVVTSLQAKLKDRLTRSCALQAICRLVWTYLHRTTEPFPTMIRKLEDVVKLVLPSGKKPYLSTDPAFADPVIELIRIIGSRFHDFCFKVIVFPLINSEVFNSAREIKVEHLEPERIVIGIRAFLMVITDLENAEYGQSLFPHFNHSGLVSDPYLEHPYQSSLRPVGEMRQTSKLREATISKAVSTAKLDHIAKEYYTRFCEILGKITLICDNAFGGQAVLDEKFGGHTPKTPITESFSFSRKDEHAAVTDYKQGFYELLHVAVQALPRCLPEYIPIKSLINLLCTGTAHVQSNIAISSANSLKAIARQSRAQSVTLGFGRFIFDFNMRYSTMSDEGMLGPGHIENTLKLYLELMQIWIEEVGQKTKNASEKSREDGPPSSRGFGLDLASILAEVEEIESHGVFFLCSQSRRVRSFAVSVLRLVTEFDTAFGRDSPRIIHILEGDILRIIDPNDDRLSIAERSRLQKGKRKSASQNTLIELCSSEVSYDSTLWFKIFPNLVRLSFELCPVVIAIARDNVCKRLLQMRNLISMLSEGFGAPQSTTLDPVSTRAFLRLGSTPPEVVIEQWKLYLVMACTTLNNAGAQTQSQLLDTQHARSKSKNHPQSQDKISSARALFAYIIPLLAVGPGSIRDAIVTALGSINFIVYRTLLESLQYAVTTCNEEAKLRVGTHQRTGSSPRKNRRTDRLRTEVTHVYKLTSRFLHETEVLQDEWIVNNLIKYTDDMRIFLSDSEIQSDWEFQTLRRHYCGLVEEVFEGINRTKEPVRWMSFEARKAAFALIEDWCGYSPDHNQISQREGSIRQSAMDHHQDNGEKVNATAAIEIEKRNLRTAALGAMASLCGGPISIPLDRGRGTPMSFDIRRMLSWIDQIFDTISDKMHCIGRRALVNLITHNKSYPKFLEHTIDMCYSAEKPKALESYFEVASQVLIEHNDCPIAFWRILGAVLMMLGNEKSHIRMKSARLLRTMEQRQQKNSKLQDFDISISDRTTAVYKLAQFEISKRLAKQHSELAFYIFSQFSKHYKNIAPDRQRNMVAAILPWIQSIELQLDPNGGPTAQTYMLLANLLEITTKSSTGLHNEVQALWQALATGPHGGNVQLVLDFVISLCLDRREQSFIDYAKQIVVFLSSTPAGQKVVEFLLMQITPRNMVHPERPKLMEESPDILGLPYVADLGDALPIGIKQSGFSLGQLSLILLVDLMVAPINLAQDNVPLLLHVCNILWDHHTILVQEQAREMLVHLIHELVISKIEDNTTTPKKDSIEDFIEAIRQHKSSVVWLYQEYNGKGDEEDGNRVPTSMTYVTNEVINLFALAYPTIHEQWAKTALNWATSCSVRHLACRSFQIFRCILSSLDQPMLADMLVRLSNTIADEAAEVQTFSMEILTTLKTIIAALEPADLLKYPQLFWATCACLDTVNEREFIETLGMLENLLEKVNLSDPAVIRLLLDAKPGRWEGSFEGIMPLVYKGLKSANSLDRTLALINRTAPLPDSELIGVENRLLYSVLANLPRFLRSFDIMSRDAGSIEAAQILATAAEAEEYQEISIVLNTFANSRYTSSQDFLNQILTTVRQSFFPSCELRSLIFLMGLLTNRLPWHKLKIMRILCILIPDIDMRRPEVACHGPDLISPLLRLLQTEYCPQALEVMDCILTIGPTPMDRQHLRMSMVTSGSRSKEYEKTQSLYGIPEDTGWSIPMPAIQSITTRANVHAVFYTCANPNPAEGEPAATPEIEFDEEIFQHGSYFPSDRTGTMMSEDPRTDPNLDNNVGDLVSKLDSLDDFFEESLSLENKYLSGYSDITITGFPADLDNEADLYDQQTAPILHQSLSRTTSVSSLQNTFTDTRNSSAHNPAVMTPTAFKSGPTSAPHIRPSLHARSITSPNANFPRPSGNLATDLGVLSDSEVDEIFSDDERSTGNNGPPMLESMIRRTKTTVKKLAAGHAGRQFRQRDLLRARSKSTVPDSPEVPKVPEAYLIAMRTPDV